MTAGGKTVGLAVSHHDVGDYDIDLLEGGSGAELWAWLQRNGFRLPRKGRKLLEDYARRGWIFAALRIDPLAAADSSLAADLAEGEIEPVLFRFPCTEPVFPLKISGLGGHPAEVLIYVLGERPVRPAPQKGVEWTVNLKPWRRAAGFIDHHDIFERDPRRTWYSLPEPSPSYLRDLNARLDGRADQFWLSRCRAEIKPQRMEDLTFVPRDLQEAIRTGDLRARTEAVSYLGQIRDVTAVPAILRFLADSQDPTLDDWTLWRRLGEEDIDPGQDVRSAIWALGEIGDRAALPELERWTRSRSHLCVMEALQALQAVDPPRAAAAALRVLEEVRGKNGGRLRASYPLREFTAAYRVARDVIVASGGAGLIPRLRAMADSLLESEGPISFDSSHPDPAWGLLMAAACGDRQAQDRIVAWLVQEARWTDVVFAPEDPDVSYVLRNPVLVIMPYSYMTGQTLYGTIERLLLPRPEVRNDLFRRAADHPDVEST
jgi:hypothetical protein